MIKVKIVGADKVIKRIRQKAMSMELSLGEAVEYAANLVKNRSKSAYLRGPRPQKLGVDSGMLTKSIRSWKEFNMLKNVIIGKVGTKMPYGKIWETRGEGTFSDGSPKRRPFLLPALLDLKPIILDVLRRAIVKGVRA